MIDNTDQLGVDENNPRRITKKAAAGLRSSLKRFGDLSGVVFNTRTSELVCGHQRMEQIRLEYGDLPIVSIPEASGESGRIVTPDGKHYFNVRLVDWSRGKQRAANVAANSQKIAGEFTDDLTTYLLEVEHEISDEEPGAFDDLLLVELLDVDLSETAEESEDAEAEPPRDVEITETYQVVIECENEQQQQEVHALATENGYKCRVLTI